MDATSRMASLVKAREGDEEAFAALVQEHSRRVFHLAFRMMRNEQDAEDVVQETFLRAYRQIAQFQAKADFGTWLYRITANCAIDAMRTRQQRMQKRCDALDEQTIDLAAGTPGPERLAQSAQLEQIVSTALDTLTPTERAAFTLRHHEGRSIDEICRSLSLGKSAAKHAVFRAVRKLRLALRSLNPAGQDGFAS
jgi:RNA polymerase sigma-70 factor (ECF subfamily)